MNVTKHLYTLTVLIFLDHRLEICCIRKTQISAFHSNTTTKTKINREISITRKREKERERERKIEGKR